MMTIMNLLLSIAVTASMMRIVVLNLSATTATILVIIAVVHNIEI